MNMNRELPMRQRQQSSLDRSGFTLLEVMIALAILAIGLVTVMQLFAGALRLSRVDKGLTEAVFVAQQVMDDLVLRNTLEDGEEDTGEEKGYQWESHVEKLVGEDMEATNKDDINTADYIAEIGADDAIVPVDIYKITVAVKWHFGDSENERVYELHSLKALAFREELQQ
ncbi:MAG: type II secretion system protein [Candidatus Coatesbacteria bacterium]|nr:type II secretion system protein [Candidatus Coatesbacteria bacterium]